MERQEFVKVMQEVIDSLSEGFRLRRLNNLVHICALGHIHPLHKVVRFSQHLIWKDAAVEAP